MSTQFSMLSVMNAALLEQGCDEVTENDGSNEYRTLARAWPTIFETELEGGKYYFTRSVENLLTRSDGSFGFDDAYVVPLTSLFVRHLWTVTGTVRDNSLDWVQDGTKVHVNAADGVWIESIVVPEDQSVWSATFASGMKYALEAVILRAIKEEYTEAREMDAKALGIFEAARTLSSQSRSMKAPFKEGRFAAARFGRG